MGAVAKRRVPGVSAAAKGNRRTATEAEFLAVLVHDGEVAFHADGTVAEDSDFCACQGFLRFDFLVASPTIKATVRKGKFRVRVVRGGTGALVC